MIARLALRNLMEHRTKSLIVGGLIAIAVSMLVLGNSIMDSISAGMRQSFTEQYSGDLFIYAPIESGSNLSIFGSFGQSTLDSLMYYDEFANSLNQQPNISLVSPMTVGMGTIESAQGEQTVSAFWGVDPLVWQQSFAQHLNWIDGGLWPADSQGIALPVSVVEELSKTQAQPIQVGDALLFTVMGNAGIKIRELTVSGIFEFKTLTAPQLEIMSLMDMSTSQSLLSLTQGAAAPVELTNDEAALLGAVDADNLFGTASLFAITPTVASNNPAAESLTMDAIDNELAASLQRNTESSAPRLNQFHFAVVLLENPNSLKETQQALQQWAVANDLDWQIGDWQDAAGFVGDMSNSIRVVLNVFVIIIAFVATLIIMNTLVISVTERLNEIGTMRAIGAQKSFVRKMILTETLLLAMVSVFIGALFSGLVLFLVNKNGIVATNDFMKILFGGDVLFPFLSVSSVFFSLLLMTTAALLASLYPLRIALNVSPLKAMQP